MLSWKQYKENIGNLWGTQQPSYSIPVKTGDDLFDIIKKAQNELWNKRMKGDMSSSVTWEFNGSKMSLNWKKMERLGDMVLKYLVNG